MSEDPRVIKLRRKVAQLLALARGGRCTEAEALNAASIADRLMAENGLTEADIAASVMFTIILPIPAGGMPRTILSMFMKIAHHRDCGCFLYGDDFAYFGHETDVIIAEYLHEVCGRAARTALDEFRKTRPYRKRRTPKTRKAASQIFIAGFGLAIGRKLAAIRDPAETEEKRTRVNAEMNRRYELASTSSSARR